MITGIKNFFNGLIFGITQIIPGVSGGTIAIILGFYFELIEAINHFFKDMRKSLKFLVPVLFGMAAGILIFSSIVDFLLTRFSFPTMLFFIGLVSGIIPHVYLKARELTQKFTAFDIFLAAFPFVFLLVISFMKEANTATPTELISNIDVLFMIFLVFAGIVSAAALIIPGMSGSFVLLLLGVYRLAIYSISSIRFFLTDFSNISLLLDIFRVVVPLGIGIILGIIFTAKLIGKLLIKYQKHVYLIMLGLLSGSVFVMFNEPMVYRSGISPTIIVIGVTVFILGAVISFKIPKRDRIDPPGN